ncbi:MAG: nuclear transport factor 2 family protein [Solirubrobacterales bacterium]|jgi:limonene-1,2-epoxide hydrolase|nr:nuclear transport factor 2 family protein [Solirubrobacterales bacterium]
MDSEQPRTVNAYFDGLNEDRLEDVGALFADDGVLLAPGIEPRTGPSQVAAYLRKALEHYPEHHDDPVRVVHAAGTATVEIRFTGRLAGGEAIGFDAVDVFDFEPDGRIRRLRTVYDAHDVRTQLAAARGGDGRRVLVAQVDHVEGGEASFAAWYERHVADVLAVPGVTGVQRYRAMEVQAAGAAPPLRRWLAVYRLSGDVGDVLEEIRRRRTSGAWEPRVSLVEETVSLAAFAPVKLDGTPID